MKSTSQLLKTAIKRPTKVYIGFRDKVGFGYYPSRSRVSRQSGTPMKCLIAYDFDHYIGRIVGCLPKSEYDNVDNRYEYQLDMVDPTGHVNEHPYWIDGPTAFNPKSLQRYEKTIAPKLLRKQLIQDYRDYK